MKTHPLQSKKFIHWRYMPTVIVQACIYLESRYILHKEANSWPPHTILVHNFLYEKFPKLSTGPTIVYSLFLHKLNL